MQRLILQFISVSIEKIIKNNSQNASKGIGNPVINAASACRDKGFLHYLGKCSESHADEKDDPKCLSPIGLPFFDILFAVTPKGDEGKAQIHDQMDDFVQAEGGFHLRKTRTRQPCQQQNHHCT